MSHLSEREVFAKTVYGEARGEPEECQIWVAWVIKNRAALDRDHWGGGTIKGVCLQAGQFECWNGRSDIDINEPLVYQRIRRLTDWVYDAHNDSDPTDDVDHYDKPGKDGYPKRTGRYERLKKIGRHVFYRCSYDRNFMLDI